MKNFDALTTEDKIVKKYARLSRGAKARRKEGIIILDGIHLVREAITRKGIESVREIFVTDDAGKHAEICDILEQFRQDRITLVDDEAMKMLAATVTPQGILVVCSAEESDVYDNEQFVLILEDIQDPSNVGAMIRTAAALGAGMVLLTKKSTDPWSPRALRAGQGAHFYTKIITDVDLESFAQNFTGKIIGSVLDDTAQSLYDTDLTGAVAIVVGNEGAGISEETKALCTQKVYIPMRSNFESLNVAHATAIICAQKAHQDASK